MSIVNLFLTTKDENRLLLKNYIGNSKFNFNPLNKPLLVGFRNYLAIINPYFYSLYLRKAFLFIFHSSQKFAKGFFIYDNNSYKHLNKYILDIKHFSTSIFKFGFLSNFKKVMKDLNFKYEGQDKYNFPKLEFPDYVFLFEENFSYSYIFNECNKTELPMVSIMNSDIAITFSSYGIISNNTGFQTSTYYTLFFIKVMKQALNLKKFDFYNNKIKVFFKNSFHFLLNLKTNKLSPTLDLKLNQPLSLILDYVSKNSITEIYFSDSQDFIKKLLILKRKRIKQLKRNLNNYLTDYNNEFYNYLKDFEFTKFFNKQFPLATVTNKNIFETLFNRYIEKDKAHFADIRDFVTFVVEVKNYNDLLNLKENNLEKFKTFSKVTRYVKAFVKKHKNLPFLNALINRKNKFNIYYFNKILRKLQYFYRRKKKREKYFESLDRIAKLYKKYNLFDEERFNFLNKNNFYYFNKFNLDAKSRAELDKKVATEAEFYKKFGIKSRPYIDEIYKDLKFQYYIKAARYHRKIDGKKLSKLLNRLRNLFLTENKTVSVSIFKKLATSIATKSPIYLTKLEQDLSALKFVKRPFIDKKRYINRTVVPPYRVKKNYQRLRTVIFLSFLKKKLKTVPILTKFKPVRFSISKLIRKQIEKLPTKAFIPFIRSYQMSDKVAKTFIPTDKAYSNPNYTFFGHKRKLNKKRKTSKRVKPTQLHIGRLNFNDPYVKKNYTELKPNLNSLTNHVNLLTYSPSLYNYLSYLVRTNYTTKSKPFNKRIIFSLLTKYLRNKRKPISTQLIKSIIKLTNSKFNVKKNATIRTKKIIPTLNKKNNKQKMVAFRKRLTVAGQLLNKLERNHFLLTITKLFKIISKKQTFGHNKFLTKLRTILLTKYKLKFLLAFVKKNFGFNLNKLTKLKRHTVLSYVKNFLKSKKIIKFYNSVMRPYFKKSAYLNNIVTKYNFKPKRKKQQIEITSFAAQLANKYNKANSNFNFPKPYAKRVNPNYIHYPTPRIIKKIIKKPKPVKFRKKVKDAVEQVPVFREVRVENEQLNPFMKKYLKYLKKFHKGAKINNYVINTKVNKLRSKLTPLINLINFSLVNLTKPNPTKVISFNFILTYLIKNRFISIKNFQFYKKYYFNFIMKNSKTFLKNFTFIFNDFILRNFFNFDLSFRKIKKIYKKYYFLKPKINQFKKNYLKIYKHFLTKLKRQLTLMKSKKSFFDDVEDATRTNKVINTSFTPRQGLFTRMADFKFLALNNTEHNFTQTYKQRKVSKFINYYYRNKVTFLRNKLMNKKFNNLNRFYYDKNYFYSTFLATSLTKKGSQLKNKLAQLKKPTTVNRVRVTTLFKPNLPKKYIQKRYCTIKTHSGRYPTSHDKEVTRDRNYKHLNLINKTETKILTINRKLNKSVLDKFKVKNKVATFINKKLRTGTAIPLNVKQAKIEALLELANVTSTKRLNLTTLIKSFKAQVGTLSSTTKPFSTSIEQQIKLPIKIKGKVIKVHQYPAFEFKVREKLNNQRNLNLKLATQFETVKIKTKKVISQLNKAKKISLAKVNLSPFKNKFTLFNTLNKQLFNKSKSDSILDLSLLKLKKFKKTKLLNQTKRVQQFVKDYKNLLPSLGSSNFKLRNFNLTNYRYIKDFRGDKYYLNFKRKSDFHQINLQTKYLKSKFNTVTNSYLELKQLYTNYFKIFTSTKPTHLVNKVDLPLFFNINLPLQPSITKSIEYDLLLQTTLPTVFENFTTTSLSTLIVATTNYFQSTLLSINSSNFNLGAQTFLFIDDHTDELQKLFKNLTVPTYLTSLHNYNNKTLKRRLAFLALNPAQKFKKLTTSLKLKFKALSKLKYRYSYRKLRYKRYRKFKPTLFGKFHYVKNKYRRKQFKYNLIRTKKVPSKIYRY